MKSEFAVSMMKAVRLANPPPALIKINPETLKVLLKELLDFPPDNEPDKEVKYPLWFCGVQIEKDDQVPVGQFTIVPPASAWEAKLHAKITG